MSKTWEMSLDVLEGYVDNGLHCDQDLIDACAYIKKLEAERENYYEGYRKAVKMEFEKVACKCERKTAQLKILCEELLDIRDMLSDLPCSGPCDSFGLCMICSSRNGTWLQKLIEMDRIP